MFSFGPEEMGSFKHWGNLQGNKPSGVVWVNVESPPVFMFTAGMQERVWTLVHLSSELKIFVINWVIFCSDSIL